MIAQVQILGVGDPERASKAIDGASHRILDAANRRHPGMVARGGGAKAVEVRVPEADPQMLILHLLVDWWRSRHRKRHRARVMPRQLSIHHRIFFGSG